MIMLMREKGFAPIIVLVGVLLVTLVGGGTTYFLTNAGNFEPKTIENNNSKEATSSRQLVLKSEESLSATPTGIPSTTHSPSALDRLKNRSPRPSSSSVSTSTPTAVPTSTAKPTVTPSPTPAPTLVPTPTPNCNTNTGSTNTTVTANSNGAVLSLSPTSGSYKKGESFSVQVNLDPKGRTIDAVDALLQFDPSKLAVNSIVGKVGSYNGTSFPSSAFNNSTGRIYLSLIDGSYAGIFNSSVTIAVINFRVLSSASGNAEIKFNFDPNNPSSTLDANVVERNTVTDALGSVSNGVYIIKPDGCN